LRWNWQRVFFCWSWQRFLLCCSSSSNEEEEVAEESNEEEEEVAEESNEEEEEGAEESNEEEEKAAAASNVEEFNALKRVPAWNGFFRTFYGDDDDPYDLGELVMGKKFAEGGQAELYEAHVKWRYPVANEEDLRDGREYVLKVFKKGTFLKHLKSQFPQGLFKLHQEGMEATKSPSPVPRYVCGVQRGMLLRDGRFAFLMEKEHLDLRGLIERNMQLKSGEDLGPFSKEDAEFMMYNVALGVDWLHSCDIVHRDLKASNVLMWEYKSGYPKWNCFVADYECSIGVIGTGFFRAPEILQACKDRRTHQNVDVFSKAADVYGFGMICYEILTGKLPFEDHPPNDYNLVLGGKCLKIPKYVDNWICKLLGRCWQYDPNARPTIGEILDMILEHSIEARRYQEFLKEKYGEKYKSMYHAEM
jgi:serine/threonine protein kinase